MIWRWFFFLFNSVISRAGDFELKNYDYYSIYVPFIKKIFTANSTNQENFDKYFTLKLIENHKSIFFMIYFFHVLNVRYWHIITMKLKLI